MSTKRGDRHATRKRHCPVCGRRVAIHSNGTVYGHYDTDGKICATTFTTYARLV
jgi:hypothetical protein